MDIMTILGCSVMINDHDALQDSCSTHIEAAINMLSLPFFFQESSSNHPACDLSFGGFAHEILMELYILITLLSMFMQAYIQVHTTTYNLPLFVKLASPVLTALGEHVSDAGNTAYTAYKAGRRPISTPFFDLHSQ